MEDEPCCMALAEMYHGDTLTTVEKSFAPLCLMTVLPRDTSGMTSKSLCHSLSRRSVQRTDAFSWDVLVCMKLKYRA